MFTILGDPYPNIELFMDENIHDYSNTELLTDGNHEFLIHFTPPQGIS